MKVSIALTKGRIEKQFIHYLESLNYNLEPLRNKGRRLLIETNEFQFILAKGVDVATYVEHGIADLGIVGEDILREYQPNVYDLTALPIGVCRFALATVKDKLMVDGKRRIATKYPKITRDYFHRKNESVDIVKLEGSVELAPILGLADAIVDLVETGTTLAENGLVILEEIGTITTRCIANRASLKIKRDLLMSIIDSISKKGVTK